MLALHSAYDALLIGARRGKAVHKRRHREKGPSSAEQVGAIVDPDVAAGERASR
jgi:hypothetical protein